MPWPMRGAAWVLVVLQATLPVVPQVLAEATAVKLPDVSSVSRLGVTPAEPVVKANRTVPKVSPPAVELQFSAEPTDGEIGRARVFDKPILTIGKKASAAENRDLAAALLAYCNRQDADDASAIENFLRSHPDSPRHVSLSSHLAGHYRRTSQFTKELDTCQQIWVSGRDITEAAGRQIVDQAAGERATLLVMFGRTDEFQKLLQELRGRPLHGAAAVKIADARDALWQMEHRPEKTFKCGPYSLSRIQAVLNPLAGVHRQILSEKSTTNGTSLYQNWLLSQKMGLKYQMARRKSGAVVPLPAMMHWKAWHFSALTEVKNGRYRVEDAVTGRNWISSKTLDEETSGYFLIPEGPLPAGWSPVTVEEGETIFGKSWPTSSDPAAGGDGCNPPPVGGSGEGGPNTKKCPPKGMAQYAFNPLRIGLEIADVPLSYAPPRGPEVEFRVTYSERTIYQSGPVHYANLGNQWTYDWLTYVQDDTDSPEDQIITIGGEGSSEASPGFVPDTKSYAVAMYSQGRMTKTSTNSYQCVYPDGSLKIFSQPDSSGGPRRVFLTRMQDPAGNALDFTYDEHIRLVSVRDAIGQVTTLSYGLTNDPANDLFYRITKVTDPFERYATFQYNSSGQLTNITDEIGITSAFAYGNAGGEADFINSLTTPYGTTTFTNNFSTTDDFNGRWLLATDPLGGQERMEFTLYPEGVGDDPDNLIPSGLYSNTGYEASYRMSFFWNKKAMQSMQGAVDYTKARQYVWRRTADYSILSRTPDSVKQPMEKARVWYQYPDQPSGDMEGSINSPSVIARVLDDGTTQAQRYEYNAIGKPTMAVDPAGRTTYFTYAANNIDLLTVAQLAADTTNVLAHYTYNAQHRPLTAVDAAGKTNYFGYNTNGQLTALTNALNQVVTLTYDTNGYLTAIAGPLGMTNGFAYDGYGRVRTVTDSEGYTVTTSYDNLDRPTRVDYLDGSYEQMTYNYLDASLMRDRNGHWTKQVHDPLRHLTDTYDGIGRHTQMSWCTCGSLESVTDPRGNVTSWVRDLQNRVTAKIYPDLTQTTYNYETNSSRLLSVTDARQQSTCYSYLIDNNLQSVSYSNAVIATPPVSFTYDTNYNRLLTMADGVGTNTYSYYVVTNGQLGSGMLASVSNSFAGSLVTYRYDALGRITNRAIDGVAEQLTYDALGRVTTITNALGSFTNSYLRATGLITTNAGPNGKTTVFSYLGVTNDQRLAEIWNRNNNGSTLSKFDYGYDAVGQITNWTQQVDNTATNVQVMQYDPVNQLLAVTVHGNTVAGAILQQYAYGYDAGGNRTTEQIGTGTNGPVAMSQSTHNGDNQLTSRTGGGGQMFFAGSTSKPTTNVTVAGAAAVLNHRTTNFTAYVNVASGTNTIPIVATDYSANVTTNKYQVVVTNNGVAKTITFDLNGNETSVVTATSTNTYQWDAANRLVQIDQLSTTNSQLTSLFTYDGYGRRVQIVELTNGVAMSTNKFLWLGMHIAEQRSSAGTVTKRFFRQGEQISGTNYFFTRDHLGSIREMVDGVGTIQARYSYDPYGRRTKVSGSLDADFGYTGDYYHAVSGLCLTFLRAYDPDLGRWLSRDPLMERAGLNLYDYVLNNPVNWLDPYGACGGGGGSQVTGGAGGSGPHWGHFFKAALGFVMNSAILGGGVILAETPIGWAGVAYGAYGAGANARNMWNALHGEEDVPTGPAEGITASITGNQNYITGAKGFDLGTGIATGRSEINGAGYVSSHLFSDFLGGTAKAGNLMAKGEKGIEELDAILTASSELNKSATIAGEASVPCQ